MPKHYEKDTTFDPTPIGNNNIIPIDKNRRPLKDGEIQKYIDGEQPGILPAEFRVVKNVLNIRGLWLDSDKK